MESPRRQRMANGDGAWKVSAVVSAIMELFLSVLLLLGAVIALFTSQLVNCFDLEPPCTQIGCSNALRPRFTKRRHTDDHGKGDSFLVRCPNCHSSLDLTKQRNKRSLHSMRDSEISSVQEGADSSFDNSDASVSDADIHHLDQNSYGSSDRQSVKISTCVEGPQNCAKFVKPAVDISEGFQDAVDTSQFANEICISSMKSRSDSAFTNDCNAEEFYEASATHRTPLWTNNLCHNKNHSKEELMDDDSSVRVIHDDCYMPLKDKDEDGELYHDSLEAMLGWYKLTGHFVLKDDINKFSETIKSHIENVQPLLPSIIENNFKEKGPSSKTLHYKHRQSLMLKTAKSSICKDTEGCRDPITHVTNGDDGEHHYVLVGGDDKDTCEPSLLKKLHCECVQPLLNSFSDDETELLNISNMAPHKKLLFDSPRSSRSEDGTHNELDELGMQATALEEGQHRYTLLDNDDEDSIKVSCFENILSDCAQPLLKNIKEEELEALRISLNGISTNTVAAVDFISRKNVKNFSDTSTCCQCPEESGREVACIKEIISSNCLQAEASLHNFSFNRCDTCPGISGCLAPSGRETVIEDHTESQNHKGILADLETPHSLKRTRKNDAGETLVDMESGFTPCSALLKINVLEDIKSSECCEPEIFLDGEALISRAFETELFKQRNFSEKSWTSFLEEDRVPIGLCVSDMEDLQAKNDNLLLGLQHQSVDKNVWQLHVEQHQQALSVIAEKVQQEKEDIQTQEKCVSALRQALWAERAMLATLETELDNERNAAAVATSEAMAMISRLQEEKSAMQLKVAQLQRMAEEKAEYDEQAMALLKEILFKREAEKYALEKEVELYRQKLLSETKKNQKKGSSKWPSSSLLLPGRIEEEEGLSSSDESSGRLKTLPSLDEFYKSESSCLSLPNKEQNTLLEENTQQKAQKLAKTQELRSLKRSFMRDQVDSGVLEDRESSESLFTENSCSTIPIIFSNNKETHIILERLRVLKEELQELQEADGVGGLKKTFEVNCLGGSRMSRKKLVTLTNSCPGIDIGETSDESRNRDCLPVHEVFEVHGTTSQQDQYNDGVLMEELEVSGDSKDMAAAKYGHMVQVNVHPGGPFPLNESQCDIGIVAGQIETCRDNKCATIHDSIQKSLVSADVVEQLLVRLHVLESDRHVLKEILDLVGQRDLEINLLQEIAQHLQQLQRVGFHGLSTNAMHQDPVSPAFVRVPPVQ